MGQINTLVQVNTSTIEDSINRLLRASNGGQSSSVGDVDVPNIVQDVEVLLENSVTRRNGKV